MEPVAQLWDRYEWALRYHAALMPDNPHESEARMRDAYRAIFARLQEIDPSHADRQELRGIDEALEVLHRVREEKRKSKAS